MADDSKIQLHVDIVSDVVCPWCFIGKHNLEAAAKMAGNVNLTIAWRPYQLDPTIPAQGRDRREYLNAKFGGEDKAKVIYSRVAEAGNAVGIKFDFEAIKISPNTLDAHRVIRWAGGAGPEIQNRLVTRLFELYFIEGADIGEHAILADAAHAAGMEAKLVLKLLASDADKQNVNSEIDHARQMGVSGVPCFLFDGNQAVMGAQPAQFLAQALQQLAMEKTAKAATPPS